MQEKNYIPLNQAIEVIGIYSRAVWLKKLEKAGIVPQETENGLAFERKDFDMLCELKAKHIEVGQLLDSLELALPANAQFELSTLLLDLGLAISSDDFLCTDQKKLVWCPYPLEAAMEAVRLSCKWSSPHRAGYFTAKELERALFLRPGTVLRDICQRRVSPESCVEMDGYCYFTQSYGEKCIRIHQEYAWLTEDDDIQDSLLEQLQDEGYTCGRLNQYYIGFEDRVFCLYGERLRIRKRLKALLETEKNEVDHILIDGKPYIEVMTCFAHFAPNPAFNQTDHRCRMDLWAFLERYPELEARKQGNVWYVPQELSKMQWYLLELFWMSYKTSDQIVGKVLAERLRPQMPVVIRELEGILKGDYTHAGVGVLQNFFLYSSKDLPQYSDQDMRQMIEYFTKSPLIDGKLFEKLTAQVYHKYPCKFHFLPGFKQRKKGSKTITAYTMEEFAVMAYCLFNPDYIVAQEIYEKVCGSAKKAELWLYLCLHWISGIRSGDLRRLPILQPILPLEQVIQQIQDNTLSPETCWEMLGRLEFHLANHPRKPNKTKSQLVPDLKLFFPESLKEHFGRLYLLVCAYRWDMPEERRNQPLYRGANRDQLTRFLGQLFVDQLGNRSFSSRAVNKSFLQCLQNAGSKHGNPIAGYFMATIARSHKIRYGEISNVTAAYLDDMKFFGETPEYFAAMMFERGVLSFIPYLMLQYLYGESYQQLSSRVQTDLIQKLDLSAHEVESFTTGCLTVMNNSQKNVSQLLAVKSQDEIREAFYTIGSGLGASRGMYSYCLRMAMNERCQKRTCLGCPYEMQTRADAYLLVGQYRKIRAAYAEAVMQKDAAQQRKYQAILKRLLYVLYPILSVLQAQEPHGDLFQWMMEELKKK